MDQDQAPATWERQPGEPLWHFSQRIDNEMKLTNAELDAAEAGHNEPLMHDGAELDEDYAMEVPGSPKLLPQQVTDAFFRSGRVGMSDQDIHRE